MIDGGPSVCSIKFVQQVDCSSASARSGCILSGTLESNAGVDVKRGLCIIYKVCNVAKRIVDTAEVDGILAAMINWSWPLKITVMGWLEV